MKRAFTLLEMIIVLSIVALLFLLTLPNIQQKKKVIDTQGCKSLIEVVNSQILLYEVDHIESPSSIDELISGGYLKQSQAICPNGAKVYISNGEAHAQSE
ncbi:MAG: prepilin-type N-terminal cleavage/methylation domain-containing protein [Erysipelotrichia bacterium]|nr:prepilin-type N-terminal cleavage/methylation domain-containing protein [Erysipelotrichia bacterium]NCC54967.1 prepilin-type N-terminal cleavage/methylation domain-containing protein [Erysipelotrichia bacterium]